MRITIIPKIFLTNFEGSLFEAMYEPVNAPRATDIAGWIIGSS